jgi:uncharacterized protein YndB with AHSA1/START domain
MTMASSGTAVVELSSDTQIRITREFDAPRHLVFEAWTTPELVERWWHAKRGRVESIDIDLRVGGAWRYAMVTTEGDFEVAFHGNYREVVPDERLVYTEIYEGMPDAAALTTIEFAELEGDRTAVTMTVDHERREHRDAHIESGMEDGLQDALDLLEELAAARA